MVGQTHLHNDELDDDDGNRDDHNLDDDHDHNLDDDDDDDDEDNDQELAQLLLDWRMESSPELRLRREINLAMIISGDYNFWERKG